MDLQSVVAYKVLQLDDYKEVHLGDEHTFQVHIFVLVVEGGYELQKNMKEVEYEDVHLERAMYFHAVEDLVVD